MEAASGEMARIDPLKNKTANIIRIFKSFCAARVDCVGAKGHSIPIYRSGSLSKTRFVVGIEPKGIGSCFAA
jgi:hypothetical protein